MTLLRHFMAYLMIVLPFVLSATELQTINGFVIDNASKSPIINVRIELLNHAPLITAVTDENGQFTLKNIPLGKHRILVMHDQYEHTIIPEVSIVSGHATTINIEIEKILESNLAEVVVKPTKNYKTSKDLPNNNMALTGIRSFTIDEVKRYPASFEDPIRLVSKFAGASRPTNETGVNIRGQNPHTISWRIDGLPISSPNHMFFAEGATGYLPIFNIYLLNNSDFINSAYSADYGNAISGVLDLGLRKGNSRNFEGSFKAGLDRLEAFLEGPISKDGRTSFIIGGRYVILPFIAPSTVLPHASDLSFKINIKTKKGSINVLGIGGISSNNIDVSELDSNSSAAILADDYTFRKAYGLASVNYKHQLDRQKGYIYTIAGSNFNQEFFNTFTDSTNTSLKHFKSTNVQNTLSSYLHYIVGPKHQLRAGALVTHHYLNYISQDYKRSQTIRDYQGHSFSTQVHAQWLYKILSNLKCNIGVNAMYLNFNHSWGISPKIALSWQIAPTHRLSFGYTWGYQMQPWEIYLNQSNQSGDIGRMADVNLGFTRNHSASLSYDWHILSNWRLKTEVYAQYLTDIPVNMLQPEISLINHGGSHNLLEETHWTNAGTAFSYGTELTLEKFFSQGYYGLLTATYFNMQYYSLDNIARNTEYNNNFIGNLIGGKEFKIGKQKNNIIFVDLSYNIKLGNWRTPIDIKNSILEERQVLDWNQAYTQRLPPAHNLDVRVGFIINQKKLPISHKIFVEVINAIHQEISYRVAYNPYTQSIATYRYRGATFNISYRINFSFRKRR